MDGHLSRKDLVEALSGLRAQLELDEALAHLSECRRCQELAVGVVEELREGGALGPLPDAWVSQLNVLDEKVRLALDELRGRGGWAGLRPLAPDEQREQIRSVLALQTRRTFEAAIAEAALLLSSDPHLAEETALTARLVAELLPCHLYPEKLKNDLQGTAMGEVGNFRRLAADWSGSKAAMQEAGSFLERGTGDLRRKGRLLSVSASLASDTGNLEAALRLVRQAAECYRQSGDREGLARVAVQEAGTLMACCRFEEAMACAEEALSASPINSRLEMLARSVVTECLIELKRPAQALLSFQATRPLYELLWGRRAQEIVGYLEGRLLDAFGCARESEKVFRELINSDLEAGSYKAATLHTLTLFESFYKRGALEKAAQVCEEAAGLLDTPFCHSQMRQVWEELVAQVRSRALTVSRILEVRLYALRHWGVPAARLAFGRLQLESAAPLQLSGSLALEKAAPAQTGRPEPPTALSDLANGGYKKRVAAVERTLLGAALQQTGGNKTTTARLVGLSRTGLEAKIKELGLQPLVAKARRPRLKGAVPRRRARYGPTDRDDHG